MKKRYKLVPRPRKYDYKTNLPVRFFINVPVKILNDLEEIGFSQTQLQKEVEKSKVVERFLGDLLEKNSKKD